MKGVSRRISIFLRNSLNFSSLSYASRIPSNVVADTSPANSTDKGEIECSNRIILSSSSVSNGSRSSFVHHDVSTVLRTEFLVSIASLSVRNVGISKSGPGVSYPPVGRGIWHELPDNEIPSCNSSRSQIQIVWDAIYPILFQDLECMWATSTRSDQQIIRTRRSIWTDQVTLRHSRSVAE